MHVDRGEYKNTNRIIDILLFILVDIILFFALLPVSLINFYEKWQLDIVDKYSGVVWMRRSSVIGYIMAMPIFAIIVIVTSGKNIYFKIIGSACSIALLKWYINIAIPSARLEKTLLSPLKEQCYTLLEIIPLIASGLCILFGILNFVFRGNMELNPVNFKNNRYIFLALIAVHIIVIPYVLGPAITIWL